MTTNKFIKTSEQDGILHLSINREDKLNALNIEVLSELRTYLESLYKNKFQYKGLILTGEGEKAFIAGADIAEMSDMDEVAAKSFSELGQQVSLLLQNLPIPTIAAVNGFAFGGGLEMALACDFAYATGNAVVGLPEVKLGLIPGFGGTQRLARVIGPNKAKEIIYTGRNIKSDEAQSLGLLLNIFENKESLINACRETLIAVSKNSPVAIYNAKSTINEGYNLDMEDALEIERNNFGSCFNTEDMKEGCDAFINKRKANFVGK